jgi:OPA family glycerol-3-phosphate transporter-like MFS transporter
VLVTIALAYVLLQFVRSGVNLWAPSYVFETYDLSLDVAGYGAAVIPFGGIVGSMISGWLSDRTRRFGRTLTMSVLIVSLSFVLLVFYHVASFTLQVDMILLFLLGLMFYGPHVLMVTVIPMEHEESHGGAAVAGFIDGWDTSGPLSQIHLLDGSLMHKVGMEL